MLLPAFPTDTELDAGYPLLCNPTDQALYEARQPINTLGQVLALIHQLPGTVEQRAIAQDLEALKRRYVDALECLLEDRGPR